MRQHDLLADRDRLIAVVGATDTPGKYGGIIYRDLRSRGHRVVAVNPNHTEVAGDPCHPNLTSLPERPDIVNMVIPPQAGRDVVEEWAELGGESIWFQPGAYDRDLVEQAEAAGMNVVAGDCVMVVSRMRAA
ncbi:MAG: CoA-binding protein [Acidimicrobiia bacterium]|nr:CoA-binding protein [Acidimicrobiia bacterium]